MCERVFEMWAARRYRGIYEGRRTNYWFDVLSLAGLFCLRGAASPPSRKLTDTPELPPLFVERRLPSKYFKRLTEVPLKVPGTRIPGTAMPTLGCVSVFEQD